MMGLLVNFDRSGRPSVSDGTVGDFDRSGRPSVSDGTVDVVREAFQRSPGKSTRRASNTLKCTEVL